VSILQQRAELPYDGPAASAQAAQHGCQREGAGGDQRTAGKEEGAL